MFDVPVDALVARISSCDHVTSTRSRGGLRLAETERRKEMNIGHNQSDVLKQNGITTAHP